MSTSSARPSPENRRAGFDAIIGQKPQIGMLADALAKQKVPHAMLFSGEEGVGKKTVARIFAMAVNCRHPARLGEDCRHHGKNPLPGRGINPCGDCTPCRKIASGHHPDVHHVQPPGAWIRIEQVRSLSHAVSLKPHEADVRVVMISDAHRMNAEAGNALLKMLEEPPEKTVFILVAPQAADILPTILSRCRQIRFNPIPEDVLETYLVDSKGLLPENAIAVASLAGGSIGRALAIKEDDWVTAYRGRVLDWMETTFRNAAGEDLYFAETLAQDRKTLELAMDIMKSWLRDLAVARHCPEKICNRDRKEEICAMAGHADMDRIVEKADAVWRAQRAVRGNANPRLTAEALLIQLAH